MKSKFSENFQSTFIPFHPLPKAEHNDYSVNYENSPELEQLLPLPLLNSLMKDKEISFQSKSFCNHDEYPDQANLNRFQSFNNKLENMNDQRINAENNYNTSRCIPDTMNLCSQLTPNLPFRKRKNIICVNEIKNKKPGQKITNKLRAKGNRKIMKKAKEENQNVFPNTLQQIYEEEEKSQKGISEKSEVGIENKPRKNSLYFKFPLDVKVFNPSLPKTTKEINEVKIPKDICIKRDFSLFSSSLSKVKII